MLSAHTKWLLVVIILILIAFFDVYYIYDKKVEEKPQEKVETIISNHKVIGKTVQERNIEVYTFGNGPKNLLFVGGIHGGYEWNSVSLAYMFIDYFTKYPESIPANITVQIIPDANPDGVYKVTGKVGRFDIADVSTDKIILASGRFNANNVDLNRNFDCKWQAQSTWQNKKVSAGKEVFSEPESKAVRDFILNDKPEAVIFWHSASDAVYASQCKDGILPDTITLMDNYAEASGYKAIKTFDAYEVTGAAEDWLASIMVPAITVELESHDKVDWEKNLRGVKSVLRSYEQ